MKKRERIKRLEGLVKRLSENNTKMRRVLIAIAYRDLDGCDPLAICTVRQLAKEELDRQ